MFLRILLSAALLVAVAAVAAPARADECILGPVSVPGLSGPPVWFDPTGGGSWRSELQDPRWSGSPLRPLDQLSSAGLGSGSDAQVRALVSGGKLYFSFQVLSGADAAPSANDVVYLAFGPNSGGLHGGYIVEIAPVADATKPGTVPPSPGGGVMVPHDPTVPYQVTSGAFRWWSTSGDISTGSPSWGLPNGGIPSWISNVTTPSDIAAANDPAVWTGSPGVSWAITFVVDLSPSGLNLTGPLKTFWGVKLHDDALGMDTAIVGNATPKLDSDLPPGSNVPTTIVPATSASWIPIETPGSCSSGVTLDRSDVGVWTGTPGVLTGGSLVTDICRGGTTCVGGGINTFRVTARGLTNPISDWAIRARLRIAGWGATIANRQYAPWLDIPGDTAPGVDGSTILTGDASQFTAANGWYWTPHDNGDGTSDVTIDYQCKKQGSDTYCPKLPGAPDSVEPHQCMLVELGQKTTGTLAQKFRNSAVFQNMNYKGMSTASQVATVSIAGLKAATGVDKNRDVYLRVETERLPPHGNQPLWLPAMDMQLARELSLNPVRVPSPVVKPQVKGRAVTRAAAVNRSPAAQRAAALRASNIARIATSTRRLAGTVPESSVLAMSSSQIVDAVWPTLRVWAYFDTGKTTLSPSGAKYEVLEPLVPFGFYLSHDGPLYGFIYSLVGKDVTLEKVAENWYRVRNVKSEGSFHVAATVTAEEQPAHVLPGGGGGPCPPPPQPPQCPECKVEHGGNCHCTLARRTAPFTDALAAVAVAVSLLVRRRRRTRGPS